MNRFAHVKGYAELSQAQQEQFEQIYTRHMQSFGTQKQQAYATQRMRRVQWVANERCFKVYFDNGDWWHYDPLDGSWY
ncbi:hypothetical protein [Paenibacillus sp. y28]|uniref:hypothetical protein n=1 Tax=Paenibacillus sp. y28 TaxID=3129110 RepID=UPI0030198CA8